MIRKLPFSFIPAGKRRLTETDRLLPLTLRRTMVIFGVFVAWKRETWIFFIFFHWRQEDKAERTPSRSGEKYEKERERETLDRTSNIGLMRLVLAIFNITLQMFLFCTYFVAMLQLHLYCMKAEIIHRNWIRCCHVKKKYFNNIF